MKNLTFEKLREVTGGRLVGAKYDDGREITSIVWDSRVIVPGCLFLCIEGEKADGHDFAQQAVDNGAAGVIAEKKIPGLKAPYILVNSVLKAAQDIATYYRSILGLTVVGVVGSVGKTSTKEMIAAVLRKTYRVGKTKGNYNNQWGVPFTIFGLNERDQVAVIEMGISDFGEMDVLSNIAKPDIVVMTNIGQSHLEFLKSRDGILKAKSEVFNHMNPEGHVILNGDDDKLSTIRNVNGKKPEYYGFGPLSQVTAERIKEHGFEGSEFDVVIRQGGGRMSFRASLPVSGKHMIYNALAAVQVALDLDVPLLGIQDGLKNVSGVEGRNNLIKTDRFTLIDDCYNASPASMQSSIDFLQYAQGRKVAILGDMLELGEDSDKYHFKVGQYVGKTDTDLIICVGEESEKMFMGAKLVTDHRAEYFKKLRDAIEIVPGLLKNGDTILLKASHSMHFDKLLEVLKAL
ncbi:MAG: UDP-N-acetylmuramoyl-tripeptide--D-alanyl-D-alanine ligase [Lachnospiraceae bacterium]|nr:UDP-N-acetylmuramoyl-tripeptide--D-alanyl-D-alanine ligase [Lachnospiraceae bacterium]